MRSGYNLEELLTEAIVNEGYSSHLYKGMGIWADIRGFKGCAKFFFKQSEEETEHEKKIINYALSIGIEIKLGEIPAPSFTPGNLRDIFKQALEHEKKVTSYIHELYDKAMQNKDWRTVQFLGWFITEQIEEEKQILDILNIIDKSGLDAPGLLLADKEIGKYKSNE